MPANLLKKYDRSVRRAKPLHTVQGESGPVRQLVKNGAPSGEILPAAAKRFSRTLYRKQAERGDA